MVKFPPVPAEVKPIAHLLKLAEEHEDRNLVVTYWARMAACLLALTIVPKQQSPETKELLRLVLDWLEQTKRANADNEGITTDAVAQALIEEYSLKVFASADQQDRARIFNKNTVKLFYTAGMLMDVLEQFGQLEEDLRGKRKYAKWKAAYIHNCLKAGEQPISGPPKEFDKPSGIVPNSMVSEEELKTFTNFGKTLNGEPATPTTLMNNRFSPSPPAQGPTTPSTSTSPIFPSGPVFPPAPAPEVLPSPPVVPAPPKRVEMPTDGSFVPTPEQIQKAQKFCKFATSALNYDDVKNALDYLHKALNLLEVGKEE